MTTANEVLEAKKAFDAVLSDHNREQHEKIRAALAPQPDVGPALAPASEVEIARDAEIARLTKRIATFQQRGHATTWQEANLQMGQPDWSRGDPLSRKLARLREEAAADLLDRHLDRLEARDAAIVASRPAPPPVRRLSSVPTSADDVAFLDLGFSPGDHDPEMMLGAERLAFAHPLTFIASAEAEAIVSAIEARDTEALRVRFPVRQPSDRDRVVRFMRVPDGARWDLASVLSLRNEGDSARNGHGRAGTRSAWAERDWLAHIDTIVLVRWQTGDETDALQLVLAHVLQGRDDVAEARAFWSSLEASVTTEEAPLAAAE